MSGLIDLTEDWPAKRRQKKEVPYMTADDLI